MSVSVPRVLVDGRYVDALVAILVDQNGNYVAGGGGGGGGTVDTIVEGNGISVDATDPANPSISIDGLTATGTSLLTAASAAAARTAIGAGTSSLALGTTSSSAAAGDAVVRLSGDQTVAGTKSFSAIPVLPASNPSSDNQAARKAYVDATILAAKKGGTANAATGSTTINAANHNGQPWQITSAGAATVTLDDDLPQGSEITIYSLGAGVVTIATETDTLSVLNGADPDLPGQYSAAFARKTGATSWTLIVGVPGGNPAGGEVVLFADNTATASYTGVTTEQTITEWSVVIPAGTVGPNSEIVIDAFYAHATGNTNVKTFRAKIGGTNLIAYPSPANAVPVRVRKSVFSNDSVSSQFQFTAAGNDIIAVSGTSTQSSSIDFSVDQTVTCTIQLGVDTDTFVGRRLRVTVRDAA